MQNKDTIELIKESRKAGMQAAYLMFAVLVCLLIGILFFVCTIKDYRSNHLEAHANNGSNYIQVK